MSWQVVEINTHIFSIADTLIKEFNPTVVYVHHKGIILLFDELSEYFTKYVHNLKYKCNVYTSLNDAVVKYVFNKASYIHHHMGLEYVETYAETNANAPDLMWLLHGRWLFRNNVGSIVCTNQLSNAAGAIHAHEMNDIDVLDSLMARVKCPKN